MLQSICFQISYDQLKLQVSGLGDILVHTASQAGGRVWICRLPVKHWDVVPPVLTPASMRWEGETGRSMDAHRPVGQAYSAEDQPILSSSPHNLTSAPHAPMYTSIKIKNEDQPSSLHLQNNYFLVYRKGSSSVKCIGHLSHHDCHAQCLFSQGNGLYFLCPGRPGTWKTNANPIPGRNLYGLTVKYKIVNRSRLSSPIMWALGVTHR